MDVNSANQTWSKWTFFIPVRDSKKNFREVRKNCHRFGRKAFGSATQMKITEFKFGYKIEILTEGHPVHDPTYKQHMINDWVKFFRNGFGQDTEVIAEAHIMAGSKQDGSPAEQMIILPSFTSPTEQ